MGDRCNYAHGYQQLRPLPDSLRQQNGVCPYWRAGHCKASVGEPVGTALFGLAQTSLSSWQCWCVACQALLSRKGSGVCAVPRDAVHAVHV